MSYKAIRLQIPFQKLLNVLDQLTPDEKLVIKKKLEKEKVASWKERFGSALKTLGKRNVKFSEEEVEADIKRAIAD